jgi:predicted Fe-Mo cluster-binding NifX family protein
MKIAIPSRNNYVDDHFGQCEYYTIYEVTEENQIGQEEIFKAPQGCGRKSNIVTILKEMGVEVMLTGHMGQGAVDKITSAGIAVYRGCYGDVRTLAESFLRNEIRDSGEIYEHHDHHKQKLRHDNKSPFHYEQ